MTQHSENDSGMIQQRTNLPLAHFDIFKYRKLPRSDCPTYGAKVRKMFDNTFKVSNLY
jgi:hypothetical protein